MKNRNSNLPKLLGIAIRRVRIEKKISQEELADLCGLHRTYIGAVERGEKNITILNLSLITDALGLSLVELLSSIE